MRPKDVVKNWVKAFNEQDVDKIVDYYSNDAINHQVANDPIEGIQFIRKMFEQEFAQADMVCIVETSLRTVIGRYWSGKTLLVSGAAVSSMF